MAHVKDAAQFITELTGGVDKLKLLKLCYFAHGWHLAWSGRTLFSCLLYTSDAADEQ